MVGYENLLVGTNEASWFIRGLFFMVFVKETLG